MKILEGDGEIRFDDTLIRRMDVSSTGPAGTQPRGLNMLISINEENPQPRLISRVVDVLDKCGVIAYPTDTTYGVDAVS